MHTKLDFGLHLPESKGWRMKVCCSDASAIPANVLLLLCFEFICFVKPPGERKFSRQI